MQDNSVTSADLNQMMTVAQLQYSSGHYREALQLCERIYLLDAYRPENLLLLGGVHFQLRNLVWATSKNDAREHISECRWKTAPGSSALARTPRLAPCAATGL